MPSRNAITFSLNTTAGSTVIGEADIIAMRNYASNAVQRRVQKNNMIRGVEFNRVEVRFTKNMLRGSVTLREPQQLVIYLVVKKANARHPTEDSPVSPTFAWCAVRELGWP